MDDFGEEKDDNKRKSRNASEKKRRDQFNILVTELGTMVSHNNRKMDKTTVLKATIAFLKQQNESSSKSQVHEIAEDWKPSFLTNEEFTHLMLEALEGFILVFGTDGGIFYASESITSLLGHLPNEVVNMSMYELIHEKDKSTLFNLLSNGSSVDTNNDLVDNDGERNFFLHFLKGGVRDLDKGDRELLDSNNKVYELVQLSGNFRKWTVIDNSQDGDQVQSDDDCSLKSGMSSRFSNNQDGQIQDERIVFVCTVRLQTTQLLREMPLVQAANKTEFISRYSLEWKFIFLDHRAPQIIGYLPFELLGTSGYDYYHMDDLDRISQCHEALMQTGEGTSCYHRFLSKGQQWIWLQTRYFITYHQWHSKPEFVVATHKVVNYTDVLKELRKSSKNVEQTLSDIGSGGDMKSHYPTTGSPTWSSRSSLGGGGNGNSSTGTGASSSRISEHNNRGSHINNKYSFRDACDSEEYFSNNDYDSIGQFLPQPKRQAQQQQQQPEQLPGSNVLLQSAFIPQEPQQIQTVIIAAAAPSGPVVSTVVTNGSIPALLPSNLRPHAAQITMTPAQIQLQEQLRAKHAELTRRISQQQEELNKISEQLLMSQYGLVPVLNVSMANSNNANGVANANSMNSFLESTLQANQQLNHYSQISTSLAIDTSSTCNYNNIPISSNLATLISGAMPHTSSTTVTTGRSPLLYTSITSNNSNPDQYTNGND